MAGISRIVATLTAVGLAVTAFAPAAQARHRHHHPKFVKKAAVPIPAHQKPGYVGIAAVPVPGLIDVGLGPVFPFGGWPK